MYVFCSDYTMYIYGIFIFDYKQHCELFKVQYSKTYIKYLI